MKTSLSSSLLLAASLLSLPAAADTRPQADLDAIANRLLQNAAMPALPAAEPRQSALRPLKALNPLCQRGRFADPRQLQTADAEALPFVLYTLNNGAPGFAILSADDRLPAVLAYSRTSYFRTDAMPDAMAELFAACAKRLETAGPLPLRAPKHVGEEDGDGNEQGEEFQEVLPIMGDISYSQYVPYNLFCPSIDGMMTLTGCVATAMTSLLKFYNYPTQMAGEAISYTTRTFGLQVEWDCAATTFDWANIIDHYSSYEPDDAPTPTTIPDEYMRMTTLRVADNVGCIRTEQCFNTYGEEIDCDIQLLLADADGQFLRTVGSPLTVTLQPNYGYGWAELGFSLPASLPDGTYRLYLGCKVNNQESWSMAKKTLNPDDFWGAVEDGYVEVTKEGAYVRTPLWSIACCYNDQQAVGIATVMAACGAAVEMDYGIDASGAFSRDAGKALMDRFGYDQNMSMLHRLNFTEEGWHNFVQAELRAGRPIYCSGVTPTYAGHAFLMDGCQQTDGQAYYHINWGWNGYQDGYFLIDFLSESGEEADNYAFSLDLITGIKPDDGIDTGYTFAAETLVADKTSANVGEDLTLTATILKNCSFREFEGYIRLYLVGEDDAYLYSTLTTPVWPAFNYYTSIGLDGTIPDEVPTGDYRIEVRACVDEYAPETVIYCPDSPSIHVINKTTGLDAAATAAPSEASAPRYDLSGRRITTMPQQGIVIRNGAKPLLARP